MAKSSRASVIKTNRKALKRKVFGPAEQARAERLSKKLMELASQPKPPRAEMDVEETTGTDLLCEFIRVSSELITDTDAKDMDVEDKETGPAADGALRLLSIPIPESLLSPQQTTTQVPTPPPTLPTLCDECFPSPTNHAENARVASEQLFYHFLGCGDIAGFDDRGDLMVNFGT
ncbi:hypothetical protein MBLNU457_5178t1 [Dothideomycetes sp. NU457]